MQKNHMTNSDTHLFTMRELMLGVERTCLSIIQAMCDKPTANRILVPEIRNKTRCPLATLLNAVRRVLARKRRKGQKWEISKQEILITYMRTKKNVQAH